MAVFSTLAAFDREELIIRLAEMAGIVRSAHAHGAAVPVVCLLDCDPHHWAVWGHSEVCCNCGTRPAGADIWHAALVTALRRASGVGTHGEREAA